MSRKVFLVAVAAAVAASLLTGCTDNSPTKPGLIESQSRLTAQSSRPMAPDRDRTVGTIAMSLEVAMSFSASAVTSGPYGTITVSYSGPLEASRPTGTWLVSCNNTVTGFSYGGSVVVGDGELPEVTGYVGGSSIGFDLCTDRGCGDCPLVSPELDSLECGQSGAWADPDYGTGEFSWTCDVPPPPTPTPEPTPEPFDEEQEVLELRDKLEELEEILLALDRDCCVGPNEQSKEGKLGALLNRIRNAIKALTPSDDVTVQELMDVRDKLQSIIDRVDGEDAPRDWIQQGCGAEEVREQAESALDQWDHICSNITECLMAILEP